MPVFLFLKSLYAIERNIELKCLIAENQLQSFTIKPRKCTGTESNKTLVHLLDISAETSHVYIHGNIYS